MAASNGLGIHIWRVEKEDPTLKNLVRIFNVSPGPFERRVIYTGSNTMPRYQCIWITALFNGPSLFSTKIALLLYYRRLFLVNQTWLKITWWANLVFVVLWALGITLFYILQCSPVNWYWERLNPSTNIKHGTCVESLHKIGTPLALSTASDFTILLMPILTVFSLKINTKRKLGLAAVFSVGFLYVRWISLRPSWAHKPAI